MFVPHMSNINITTGNLFQNASIHSTASPSALFGARGRGRAQVLHKGLESVSSINAQMSSNYLSKVTYHSINKNQAQSIRD